jgi:hypothetical protein
MRSECKEKSPPASRSLAQIQFYVCKAALETLFLALWAESRPTDGAIGIF